MKLLAPEWLIFVPLWVAAAWFWPHWGLRQPLRVSLVALWLLILTQPQIRRLSAGLDVWVLVDRSVSAVEAVEARWPEWQSLLEHSKSGSDRLIYVDYADVAVLSDEKQAGIFPGTRQQTRTGLAVQFALSRMAPDRAARLLVLTDGYSSEPLSTVGERLVRQEVALDYRLATMGAKVDYRVESLKLPNRVQPAEPFVLEVSIAGERDGAVPYELRRDGQFLAKGETIVEQGQASLRFVDRVQASGAHQYQLRILPAEDALMGNNAAENWMEVESGPRLLLITGYAQDPLAMALRAQGFAVEVVEQLGTLQPGQLSGVKGVIMNNVPAYRVPSNFLAALDFYVQGQGGGLWMIGGKYSFGSGGYFGSAVDGLLPISMELRKEHRKLAVALAVVLDRSGSMAASVGGTTKMALADEGTARAIELLGDNDLIAVYAVDSEAHEIAPLTRLEGNRRELTNVVRRIQSTGGGIYVYEGLKAGWEALKKAQVGQRHLILFSDAADSEVPGDYKNLIATMRKAGVTISVIGMGSEKDCDAKLLQDIAERGGGRIFFNENATDLPALFAQETVAVARSAFIEEAVKVQPAAAWQELAAKPMPWLAAVDGYNLSYLKPEASAALFSADEYQAPLVAYWQRGAGRVVAVSFPMGGDFSQRVRGWPSYGDFAQTLTRWMMGERTPPGLGLKARVEGTQLQMDLLYDETWEQRISQDAPRLVLAEGLSGALKSVVWERLQPGHFTASTSLQAGQWVRGAVQVGKTVLPFGPVVAGLNPEWAMDRQRVEELKAVARMSGGVERVNLKDIWKAPRRAAFQDLRPWLLVGWLGLFLVEAFQSRTGFSVRGFFDRIYWRNKTRS